MANDVYYNMGQIRYDSTKLNEYNNSVIMEIKPYKMQDKISGLNYRDILFDFTSESNPNFSFNSNDVYCIDLSIPRNQIYDMIFDLLLVTKTSTTEKETLDLNNYQQIRRIKVPKSGEKATTSTVVLYPNDNNDIILYPNDNNDDIKVGIVRDGNRENSNTSVGDLVKEYDNNSTKIFSYWLCTEIGENGTKIWKKVTEYKDAILAHVWEAAPDTEMANFKIVFSNKVPSKTDFNCLLLKMKRIGDEADIQYTITDESYNDFGESYYGILVDDHLIRQKTHCYKLNNWISKSDGIIPNITNSMLNSIGVWSHPDSIMAINGEEIRIGQSGYYELNDFNITHFSMLITGNEDKFSIDYQYKIN